MSKVSTAVLGAIRATCNNPKMMTLALGIALLLLVGATSPATAQGDFRGGVCSNTAFAAFNACGNEVKDDYWEALGICANRSSGQGGCAADAREERNDGFEECHDQREARLEICEELGEDAYLGWEDWDEEFIGEGEFDNQNPYMPIAPGNQWMYEAEDEVILTTVYDAYKLIDDVTCIVVNDVGEEEDEGTPVAKEDTDDWFAVDVAGNVHYCGEISMDFEYMEDDSPAGFELVEIEGSWKAGRDGARSGILMPGDPFEYLGDYYRQEWAFGDAEDMGEMLTADYYPGDDEDIDEVLAYFDEEGENELVEALEEWCDLGGGCVVTRDFTPVEPDVEEFKFYAYGIGLVLEIKPPLFDDENAIEEEGEFVILVGCNVDPACPALP